jgi:hypothetical protein
MRVFAWAAHVTGCLSIPAFNRNTIEEDLMQEDREEDEAPVGGMDPYSAMNNKY